jgi:WD40 repeat protein
MTPTGKSISRMTKEEEEDSDLTPTRKRTRRQSALPDKENVTGSALNQGTPDLNAAHKRRRVQSENPQVELKDEPIQFKAPNWSKMKVKTALRMHWRSDANDDERATIPDVWDCRFQPTPIQDRALGLASHVVATCGSHSVCFTDCDRGVVVMKYTHLDESNEQFQCLDWTLVKSGDLESPVLAVAGTAKTIKLINTKFEVCYRYLKGHRSEIVDLKFLKYENRLLSASRDSRVFLWDIGDGFESNNTES